MKNKHSHSAHDGEDNGDHSRHHYKNEYPGGDYDARSQRGGQHGNPHYGGGPARHSNGMGGYGHPHPPNAPQQNGPPGLSSMGYGGGYYQPSLPYPNQFAHPNHFAHPNQVQLAYWNGPFPGPVWPGPQYGQQYAPNPNTMTNTFAQQNAPQGHPQGNNNAFDPTRSSNNFINGTELLDIGQEICYRCGQAGHRVQKVVVNGQRQTTCPSNLPLSRGERDWLLNAIKNGTLRRKGQAAAAAPQAASPAMHTAGPQAANTFPTPNIDLPAAQQMGRQSDGDRTIMAMDGSGDVWTNLSALGGQGDRSILMSQMSQMSARFGLPISFTTQDEARRNPRTLQTSSAEPQRPVDSSRDRGNNKRSALTAGTKVDQIACRYADECVRQGCWFWHSWDGGKPRAPEDNEPPKKKTKGENQSLPSTPAPPPAATASPTAQDESDDSDESEDGGVKLMTGSEDDG